MKKMSTGTAIIAAGLIFPDLYAQSLCFEPPAGYLAGTGTKTVCVADFNGDGKPDLALSNHTTGISIVLNNGDGSFGQPSTLAAGALPWALCSADFNGDGKADLASHNMGPGTVSILLGDGTGNFSTAPGFNTGIFNTEASLCAGDFDNNGDMDLAVGSGFNYMLVALGNGDGTFGSAVQFTTGGGRSITAADFNGDGKTDLATTLSVMSGNGTGGFAAPVSLSLGVAPISLISADFNGDGKADLVATDMNDNTTGNLSIILGNASGNFAVGTFISVGNQTVPSVLCSGDFNGDGKMDVATAAIVNHSVGKVAVLPGNGSGGFGAYTLFAVDSFPQAMVAADLNTDGKTDLALAVSQSNADTAGKADILLNCTTLSLNESDAGGPQAVVYPNPNEGRFTVSCSGTLRELTVTDVSGKVVYQTRPVAQTQTVELTTNGIYVVRVTTEKQTFLKKIVVSR